MELSVNSGFHLLALLDTNIGATSDVDTLLGLVGYMGTKGSSDDVTSKSAIEVVEAVLSAGGIPIPAHTDRKKGLLRLKDEEGSSKREPDPNTVRQVLDSTGILAMEVTDPDSDKPAIYLERNPMWAEILGSDSHHPSDGSGANFSGSHYTWVKMAKPSLEGLRLALLDGGGFSIRRSDEPEHFDPFGLPMHFIEEVQIENARYMGHGQPAKLTFNPSLNALVGGRGTGKSTVIHALRLAARRDRELDRLAQESSPRSTFERFNQVPADRTKEGGLLDQTSIRLTIMRDGVRHRIHWRQDGTGTVVEEESDSGVWEASSAQIVTPDRFPARVYSQGEVTELSGANQ